MYRIPERSASAESAAVVTVPFDAAHGEAIPTALEDRLRDVFNA